MRETQLTNRKNGGFWYRTFLTPEEDEALQTVGLKLVEQKLLWDSRRKKFIELVDGRVPGYSILKHCVREFLKQNGYSGEMVSPDEQLRIAKRTRRIL